MFLKKNGGPEKTLTLIWHNHQQLFSLHLLTFSPVSILKRGRGSRNYRTKLKPKREILGQHFFTIKIPLKKNLRKCLLHETYKCQEQSFSTIVITKGRLNKKPSSKEKLINLDSQIAGHILSTSLSLLLCDQCKKELAKLNLIAFTFYQKLFL